MAIPNSELDQFMTDRKGMVRFGTLPPGSLTDKNEDRLKKRLSKNIPDHYAEVVNKTKDSYIQVIYTVDLDSYRKGRMCLIGDAGIFVPPFTGSGVFKGYSNVKDLVSCLKEYENLEDALEQWSKLQLRTGKRLLALGDQMEKAYIWEQLDFTKVDEKSTREWWESSITFPENFNHTQG